MKTGRMVLAAVAALGLAGSAAANGFGPGPAFLPEQGVFFTAVASNATTATVFRFFNMGHRAGTATATLYDSASGAQLGTWTSASIPAFGALEVSAATVAANATPKLTATQLAAPYNAMITSTLQGTVQEIVRTGNAVFAQSNCGAIDGPLGYVEGPGFAGVTGLVRIVNNGRTAGTITLALRDPATGNQLGTWTSASVPAKGAVTVSTATIAAAATPIVPASTVALNIFPTGATARLAIEHFATPTATPAVANLTGACGI